MPPAPASINHFARQAAARRPLRMTSYDTQGHASAVGWRQSASRQLPDGAHVAVQFVLNHEEGGENNILHGDAASEAFLSEIPGAAQWRPGRH